MRDMTQLVGILSLTFPGIIFSYSKNKDHPVLIELIFKYINNNELQESRIFIDDEKNDGMFSLWIVGKIREITGQKL